MPTRAIKAIFFTRFHPEKGSHVLHQVPEGSITPSTSPSALPAPLLSFDSITTYLIPNQQFCDRLLTFCSNHHRVIGYPVCIREGKYSRNEFIFNFAIVIEEGVGDWVAYGEVTRKMGKLLRGLEEQGGFLSREEGEVWGAEDERVEKAGLGAGSKVYALCEMILEDLNNYAECMIPIDDSNTINLKLFPTHPPPPPISAYQVPLLTISLQSLTSPISSDLTLTRILPHINGINSVARIAQIADTDLSLTRKAIQHLVYYGCLILLDIFSFGAIYAPTAEIGGFIMQKSVQEECARYVRVPRLNKGANDSRLGSESEKSRYREDHSSLSSEAGRSDIASNLKATDFDIFSSRPPPSSAAANGSQESRIPHETLIALYTSLRQGLTLKNWVLDNLDLLNGIDIRRLITFGIIKGFLYRVHKYAVATSTALPPAPPTSLQSHSNPASTAPSHRDSDVSTIRGHHGQAHGHAHGHINSNNPQKGPLSHKPSLASTANVFTQASGKADGITKLDSMLNEDGRDSGIDSSGGLPLVRFLDGMHAFDEICTELGMSERVVEGKIKGAGDVVFVYR